MVLIQKNGLWRKYDTKVFGLHMIHIFAYIWYKICWRAYDLQFSRTYDTLLSHNPNPNPTHRVAYTRQSTFFRINTTSFHLNLTYYLYAFSWDRVGSTWVLTKWVAPSVKHLILEPGLSNSYWEKLCITKGGYIWFLSLCLSFTYRVKLIYYILSSKCNL